MATKYVWTGIDPRHVEAIAEQRAVEEARAIIGVPGLPENAYLNAARAEVLGSSYTSQRAVVNIQDAPYNGVLDGVTLNDTAWASAVAAAQAVGAKLVMPAGILQLSATASWPAGLDIEGQGKDRTIVRVAGAINGLNAHDAGSSYAMSGTLKGFTLQGTAGALVGVDINFRRQPKFLDIEINGFAQQGVYFNNCIMPTLGDGTYVINCGNATKAQVEVENCTTFYWDHAYISGTGVTTIAGLAIDKSSSSVLIGGAIESTGIPLRLGGKADSVAGVNGVALIGINLENPNNGAVCYIEMGAGWTGAAGQGVTGVFGAYRASPSGSTTVAFSVKAQNTDTVHLGECRTGLPTFAAGGIANFELAGVNNFRWSLGITSGALGASLIHVRENGVARPDALPSSPWEQFGRSMVLTHAAPLTVNSATPDASGASYIATANSSLTTITNITGGRDGQVMVLAVGDANTTLKHNNGGAGSLWMFDRTDYLVPAATYLLFLYESAGGFWRQIGHNVVNIGPGTGDYLAGNNAAGQIRFTATGSEADIAVAFLMKGAGFFKVQIVSQFAAMRVGNVAGGNWVDIFPNVAGSPGRVAVGGADTDIDLNLEPKGAGVTNINLPATIANGGGAAPTVGTIGGSGPTTAAQNGWLKIKVAGTVKYIPLWA